MITEDQIDAALCELTDELFEEGISFLDVTEEGLRVAVYFERRHLDRVREAIETEGLPLRACNALEADLAKAEVVAWQKRSN